MVLIAQMPISHSTHHHKSPDHIFIKNQFTKKKKKEKKHQLTDTEKHFNNIRHSKCYCTCRTHNNVPSSGRRQLEKSMIKKGSWIHCERENFNVCTEERKFGKEKKSSIQLELILQFICCLHSLLGLFRILAYNATILNMGS